MEEAMSNNGEAPALPDEVLFLIFTLLTPNSMRSACLVSHQWHQVAKDNWTWKALCEKEELTMNSANRRKYGDDWLAWYRALQEGSFDILDSDNHCGIELYSYEDGV